MKKVIALVLAMIMLFSTGMVAFAADVPAEGTTAASDADDSFDPMDLPAWMVPVALKLAKVALKLAKVFVKIATIFGIVDKGDLVNKITDFINSIVKPGGDAEVSTTAPLAA
ncbi:MAG: hypothetical protein Q4D20_09605 [Clostridia bacterium]|nr:hypothetical protein [Clostridia bacterium]